MLCSMQFWTLLADLKGCRGMTFYCYQELTTQAFSLKPRLIKPYPKRTSPSKNSAGKNGWKRRGNLKKRFTNRFLRPGDFLDFLQTGRGKFLLWMRDLSVQFLKS